MEEKKEMELTFGKFLIITIIILILIIATIMWIIPKYKLWKASYEKKIQVEDALGKKLAAIELKEAEIIRAEGIAKANEIIADSITTEYIKYKFIEGLNDGNTEVIYVPTESNLPILEARNK